MAEHDVLEETHNGKLAIRRVVGKYCEYEYVRLDRWSGTVEPLRSFVQYYLTKVKTLEKHPPAPFDKSVLTPWAQEHFFPHQYEALDVAISKHDGRCIGALDMGMGKTLIGWAFAKHYGGDILVLCPKITKKAWIEEGLRTAGINAFDIESSAKAPDDLSREAGRAYVVTYDLGKRLDQVLEHNWHVIIADEAHYLRGENSVVSVAYIKAMHRARAVLLLTGTPQYTKPSNLYSLLHIIRPEIYKDRRLFSIRYCNGHETKDGTWKERGVKNVGELAAMLHTFMYRLRASGNQYGPFDEYFLSVSNTGKKKIRFPKRRKCATEDAERKETLRLWRMTNIKKQPIIFPIVHEEIMSLPPGQTAVVFAHHHVIMQNFSDYLTERGVEHHLLHSRVSEKKKREAIEATCKGETKCVITGMKGAGTGLTLVPGGTLAIYLEIPLNPLLKKQCNGRIHRHGQLYPVKVIMPIVEDSFDMQIPNMHASRQSTFDRVVDGNTL